MSRGQGFGILFFYRFYFIEVRIAARVIQITASSTLRPEVERAGAAGEHSGGHSSNANTPRRTAFTTFNGFSSAGSPSSRLYSIFRFFVQGQQHLGDATMSKRSEFSKRNGFFSLIFLNLCSEELRRFLKNKTAAAQQGEGDRRRKSMLR